MAITEQSTLELLGLGEYDSDSQASQDAAHPASRDGGAVNLGTAAASTGQESDHDSYFEHSGSDSEDSATQRRKAAERRLSKLEDSAKGPSSASSSLPPPLATLQQAPSRLAFLNPEATRPLASSVHRNRPSLALSSPHEPSHTPKGPDKGASKGADFDIARMAPPLKGQSRAGAAASPHPGAVISAAPQRAKPADDPSEGIVTAAQIAMLGGQWRPSEQEDVKVDEAVPYKRKATQAMGVNEFLDRGVGGAALPRNRQDRKDKEKLKRHKGQSAIGEWKTEAEMVLRQQYDT